MSTDELPDFNTAPAWLLSDGVVLDSLTACASVRFEPAYAQRHAPWTPLDTAENWVQRIDRDKLAEVIDMALQEWHDGDLSGTDHDAVADAALAALSELMKGEQE